MRRAHLYGEDLVLGLLLLTLLLLPNPPILLTLQLIVQQEERLFICLWSTNDGEHTFACLIVWRFRDGDLGARQTPDLSNFGATTANDAANHIRWYGDVLSSKIGGVSCCRWRGGASCTWIRVAISAPAVIAGLEAVRTPAARALVCHAWVIENGTKASLPVF